MSKVKTFDDIVSLGVNSIHEHTHISRAKLELLLNKSFGEINRVQFMGFLSILEREYSVNLSSLRDEYDGYLQMNPNQVTSANSAILQAPSNPRIKWVIGGILLIIVLIGFVVLTQNRLSNIPKEEVIVLNTSEVNRTEPALLVDQNSTIDSNVTETNSTVVSEENTTKSSTVQNFGHILRIEPASKVWVGMMDLQSGVKTQKLTSSAIEIDTAKNWLLIFGHGRLKLIGKDSNTTLKERNTAWFAYENGVLTQLTSEQFNLKNKGSNW
ncbi:MAG: hypothetical protein PHW18_00190 [Sulfuricurvum sp.]|uniref:hypothetical protein n=1 Tax=Sulfuricurvum sp. TaxID=2025608 RepID=UPI00260BD4AE|nr:hypothetical protein [Sulfuricurvum sp.]MDD2827973.1 hypothetical protein [Sulfuricurvum sp.]MDD4948150.1 hypothetical protein [Sulfuricurvum sp.]